MRSTQKNKSNIIVGRDVLLGMLNGIARVTKAIRVTYGGMGLNSTIETELYPYHFISNNAQDIIQKAEVYDSLEKRGLNFLKELSDKANKDSGDGRKTTCILAEEILRGGYEANVNGLQLKKELYDLIPFIEAEIDKQKKTIDVNNVKDVATIAGESEEIGNLIQEIYTKIGKNGVIHVEGSGTYNTYYDFVDGVRFANGTGYLGDTLAHDPQAKKDGKREAQAVYEKPVILVTKQKITNYAKEIDPLLQALVQQNKRDLVIFTDDMDDKVVSILIGLHKSGDMNICIIKPSVLFKDYVFEDFAKCVGATIIDGISGINLSKIPLSALGTCDKIVVNTEETILTGTADISDHIARLKEKGDNDSLLRIMWLSAKTATIKLGAGSESELSYKRLKCQDAVNSAKLALEDGIVEGGGKSLLKTSIKLTNPILSKALKAPYEQIIQNGCQEIPDYVVDAAKVVKNAIRNAINLAGIVLTTGVVINLPEKSFEDKQLELLDKRRSPF